MPPKSKKSVLLMVTNIGSTSLEQISLEDEPFIDKAKYAMKMLVEKKIFMQPKDEIGIITMGDETCNSQEMDHVKEYNEHLLIPNWEMVKYINGLSSTKYPCNWIEALHVTLCFMKREVVNPECTVFVVIFNNFKEDAESIGKYDADNIIDDLNNYGNLRLLFVGENALDKESCPENSISPSEQFALSVINQAGAQYEQINNFIEARRFFVPPSTTSMPWKFELEWAGLNISCSNYVKVSDAVKQDSWKMTTTKDSTEMLGNFSNTARLADSSKCSNMNIINNAGSAFKEKIEEITNESKPEIVKKNIKMDLHRNEIKLENIINGYKYGGKYIPFSDDDETAMKYSGSEKGMMVYGFVPQDEVKLEYWTGSGSRIIVPTTNDDAVGFYSLVQAMVDKKYAAIVRKVYANNNLPKMGVLFPKVEDDDIWCLVHVELPFVNDLRVIKKRPIISLDGIVNKEKSETLGDFIDAMTITDNEPVYLNPGMFPNICNQYYWNAVADRILNPKSPLLPVNNYLKTYLEPPEDLSIKVKPHLEKLDTFYGKSISKESDKDQKSDPVAIKDKQQANNVVKDTDKDVPKVQHNTDVGFFSPEDFEMSMGELDDM